MKPWFEEIDYRKTPIGEIVLQRRRVAALGNREIYEVKLGDEYLMSSLFFDAEAALADRCLARLDGRDWDIVVGGLGLGYTAMAALKFRQVRRLVLVEYLQPVIDWHIEGLTPNGKALTDDPRCVYRQADFFALARGGGFDPAQRNRQFDAILLDIDHTPTQLLDPAHADLYTEPGLTRLRRFLKPDGVFGLWSNEEPSHNFLEMLGRVFGHADGITISFDNPLQGGTATNGIYIAHKLNS